jgi:surface-anchored protein
MQSLPLPNPSGSQRPGAGLMPAPTRISISDPMRRHSFTSAGFLIAIATLSHGQSVGTIELESAAVTVNEQAAYHTVKVLRTGGTSGVVSVSYTSSDGTASSASDYVATIGNLIFADGEAEKVISVQIANDSTVETAETFNLTLTGPQVGTLATTVFTINDTPTIGTFTAPTTPIGTATAPITFTIADPETAAGDLSVTAFTTNPTLLPPSGILLGGSGATRTITLNPAAGLAGTAPVTILVTDTGGAVAVRTFTLSVGNASAATALAITSSTPANSVPNVVLTADESFTLNYTVTNSAWVTNVTFVELDNANLIGSHGTSSTSDLRTQPGISGATARSLRIRGRDNSTSVGEYGRANVALGFTGAGAPANTHTFNLRVNPRAVADNNLLAIPGTTSTFDVLANDAKPITGHAFSITSVSSPTNGTLYIAPGGQMLRYTPTNPTASFDTFTYTVTVSSADAFNGYEFTGIGYVKIGGYIVVDSATSSQHIDLDFDYINGKWSQIIRTDATVGGSVQSGTFSPSVFDADEGVLFFDPSTKQPRNASALLDVLGVPAGADVWYGPTSSSGNKLYLGIANESTSGIEAYTPVGDSRATTNTAWVATKLIGFTGPGHFAAFDGTEVAFDTYDGLNSPTDSASGDNVSDTFWGLTGSHAHPGWYFTAPGNYTLTFQTTVKANGVFVTSPPTTFHVAVDTISGNARLLENPPLARLDVLAAFENGAAVVLDVLANDSSDADGFEELILTSVGNASHGTTALAGDGKSVSYTPAPEFNGSDSFTYTVTDEHGGISTGTVSVTVIGENDPPVFSSYSLGTPYETAATISFGKLLSKITDPEGDVTSITAAGPASVQGGTASLQAGSILYTPPSGFSGVDQFSVTFQDVHGSSVIGTVNVTVGSSPNSGGQGTNSPLLTMLPGGDIGISFQGIPGRSYQVQRSTDLSSWTPLTTVVAAANGAVTYTDEDPPEPSAFYRLAKP